MFAIIDIAFMLDSRQHSPCVMQRRLQAGRIIFYRSGWFYVSNFSVNCYCMSKDEQY